MTERTNFVRYPASRHMSAVELLRILGYRFDLDFDDEVKVEQAAGPICWSQVNAFVREHLGSIQNHLHFERKRNLAVFVGGPFSGQQYRQHLRPYCVTGHIGVRMKRGQWAVYQFPSATDHRCYFRGIATTERNAKRGHYSTESTR